MQITQTVRYCDTPLVLRTSSKTKKSTRGTKIYKHEIMIMTKPENQTQRFLLTRLIGFIRGLELASARLSSGILVQNLMRQRTRMCFLAGQSFLTSFETAMPDSLISFSTEQPHKKIDALRPEAANHSGFHIIYHVHDGGFFF